MVLIAILFYLILIYGGIVKKVSFLEPNSEIPDIAFRLGMEYAGLLMSVLMLIVASCIAFWKVK